MNDERPDRTAELLDAATAGLAGEVDLIERYPLLTPDDELLVPLPEAGIVRRLRGQSRKPSTKSRRREHKRVADWRAMVSSLFGISRRACPQRTCLDQATPASAGWR